jgi:hypothetical protein
MKAWYSVNASYDDSLKRSGVLNCGREPLGLISMARSKRGAANVFRKQPKGHTLRGAWMRAAI